MKIRRITATPVNFPLEAPYGWVFGELPGDRRLQARAAHNETIEVPTELVALLERYATHGSPAATT